MPQDHRARDRPRGVRIVLGGIFGAVLAGGTAVGAAVFFVRITASGHLFDEDAVPAAPVALVLGARVFPDGTPSTFLAARLDLAHRLYVAGKVEVILVSGDNLAPEHNEPDAMRSYLIRAGVPAEKIVSDYAGFDTYDSCFRARRIFGVSDLIVVTQRYHLPRAVATARQLGLSADGVGDQSSRQVGRSWRRGTWRDQVACVKTMFDLATSRRPLLGPPDLSVQRALSAE